MRREFWEALGFGEPAERWLRDLLTGDIIYTGRATAPGEHGGGKLYRRDGVETLPDLQHFPADGGQPCWFEAKRKNAPRFHRLSQTWRHGIDLPKVEAYEHVASKTGWPVFVVIFEDHGPEFNDGEVLAIELSRARYFGEFGRFRDGTTMWFWPRSVMWPVENIEACGGFVPTVRA